MVKTVVETRVRESDGGVETVREEALCPEHATQLQQMQEDAKSAENELLSSSSERSGRLTTSLGSFVGQRG